MTFVTVHNMVAHSHGDALSPMLVTNKFYCFGKSVISCYKPVAGF